MISYKDLCILKLTGIAKKYNEKELIIPEEIIKGYYWGDFFTCEFLKDSKYIIRGYWENGNKYCEKEYKNGLEHGKSFGWYKSGNKKWGIEYQNGLKHGNSIAWHENGDKWWEEEWENGKLHGKSIEWCRGGNKWLEEEYENGKRIRKIK